MDAQQCITFFKNKFTEMADITAEINELMEDGYIQYEKACDEIGETPASLNAMKALAKAMAAGKDDKFRADIIDKGHAYSKVMGEQLNLFGG